MTNKDFSAKYSFNLVFLIGSESLSQFAYGVKKLESYLRPIVLLNEVRSFSKTLLAGT